ncbi:hypothetical protein GCM10027050_06610 [Psychrosphaera aestuarii]
MAVWYSGIKKEIKDNKPKNMIQKRVTLVIFESVALLNFKKYIVNASKLMPSQK